jgi:hypothetical protein
MDGGKIIMSLKTIVNLQNLGRGIRKNSSVRLSSLLLSYMDLNFRDAISLDNCGQR